MNVKEAIISFQYAERIKSGLIIASKLVDQIDRMTEKEQIGAEKLLIHFINALMNEIRIAYNASNIQAFQRTSQNLEKSIPNIQEGNYDEALKNISQAISSATTGGQEAAETLKRKGYL